MENQNLKSLVGNGVCHLTVTNQQFIEESLLSENKRLNNSAFSEVSFVKCRFEEIEMVCNAFSKCEFQDCIFLKTNLSYAEVYHSKFKTCSFINCDLSDAEIENNIFDSCVFDNIKLINTDFSKCEFICPQFKNIPDYYGSVIEDSKITLNDSRSIMLNAQFDLCCIVELLCSDPWKDIQGRL